MASASGGSSAAVASLPPVVHHAVAMATSQALGETSLALLVPAFVGTGWALAVPTAGKVVVAADTQPPSRS